MEFRDPIIKSVVEKFVQRSNVGYKKYGVTLQDDDGNALVWLDHLQEEQKIVFFVIFFSASAGFPIFPINRASFF